MPGLMKNCLNIIIMIYRVSAVYDDNGNGTVDENGNSNDADKVGVQTDDTINGGDGSVDEDPNADMHDDGSIANIQRPLAAPICQKASLNGGRLPGNT